MLGDAQTSERCCRARASNEAKHEWLTGYGWLGDERIRPDVGKRADCRQPIWTMPLA